MSQANQPKQPKQSSYDQEYQASIENNEDYWAKIGRCLDWFKPYNRVKNVQYTYPEVSIRWFEDGQLNACYNCVDRHAQLTPDATALIWESDLGDNHTVISYADLQRKVMKMANVLKSLGVSKGDRVSIVMTMVPELAYAVLACARIGAVHSVIFAGFSAESIAKRIQDCQSEVMITMGQGVRGGKTIALKSMVDEAMDQSPSIKHCLVINRYPSQHNMKPNRDVDYLNRCADVDDHCDCQPMMAEDPLFVLYTSGSTGNPKGILHTTGGYLVYAAHTHARVFDVKSGEVYWCTADLGWITGHSYALYGPLANGVTSLMFEGTPNHPSVERFWTVVEKHKVAVMYTAPTIIRSLMRHGERPIRKHDISSLRCLGSVGEPLNPSAWHWYHEVVGQTRCDMIDSWWQTETGGMMITAQSGRLSGIPGSVGKPFYGITPKVMQADGSPCQVGESGLLCMADSWPGQMRTIYGDHQRFLDTYFKTVPGYYFSGDGAKMDASGDYWISGRLDDVLIISGHNLGTAELENALVAHPDVVEAAVVGVPHAIKGQSLIVFITLKADVPETTKLIDDVRDWLREKIGPVATPDLIHISDGLPKTRSGKIMRRILRKIAEGETADFGNTTTLADPSVIDALVAKHRKLTKLKST